MVISSVFSAISAMAAAEKTAPPGSSRHPLKPVVTISRDYGSGGDIIAERLAQRLGVELFDDAILKQIAVRLHEDPAAVRLLDQSIEHAKNLWFYRLLSGKDLGIANYRESLVKVVTGLGRLGGVIVGRGAHVILAESCSLRIRIAGSPEICAKRMARNGLGDLGAEIAKAKKINHRRGKFTWEMFHCRLSDAHQFDITINTDRMDDFEDVVDMLFVMANAIHAGRVLSNEGNGVAEIALKRA